MRLFGVVIGFVSLLLYGVLIARGAATRLFRVFPLFYSYAIYIFSGSVVIYLIYWLDPRTYAHAYWFYYLVTILAEFVVLVEISDQVFRSFPAIRSLGRALTILISVSLGVVYILPAILRPSNKSAALLDLTLRASTTKALVLVALFYAARHYGSQLGRNVGGLMLGFSIFVGVNVAIMAAAKTFGRALFAPVLWVAPSIASVLCVTVWTVTLWEASVVPDARGYSTSNPEPLAIQLTRFNSLLTKFLHK